MASIDLGRLKVVFRGTYNPATAYTVDDTVVFTDTAVTSTYICLANTTGNAPSTAGVANATYWAYMAKGTDAITMTFNTANVADFTASSKNGYFVNTTSGPINITFPASPQRGDQIIIMDYAKTFHTNSVTILRNGNKIEGNTDDYVLYAKGADVTFTFDGNAAGQVGWKITTFAADNEMSRFSSDGTSTPQVPGAGSKKYLIATSDAEEIYFDGDYMVHKFLTSGTFSVKSLGSDATFGTFIRYLIVGGGGSGGTHHAGGGGAGGYQSNGAFDQAVTVQNYTITVGAGGAARTQGNNHGNAGSNSNAFSLTSGGGGGGGSGSHQGQSGGSGGGSGHSSSHGSANGQGTGHRGGNHQSHNCGGGGGAGTRGKDQYGTHEPGQGGDGIQNSITGVPLWYAGGGGGSSHNHTGSASGGLGGGGMGSCGAGEDGFGGGGGAAEGTQGSEHYGGKGGDGIVVIRYKAKD
jgi:hypothetical protein